MNLQHHTSQGYLPCSRRMAGYLFIDFWTTYIVTSNTGYSGQQQKLYIRFVSPPSSDYLRP